MAAASEELAPVTDHFLFVLPKPMTPDIRNSIREHLPSAKISHYLADGSGTQDVPSEIYYDKNVIVSFGTHIPTPEQAPDLRLLHLVSAGTEHIEHTPLYKDSDVAITCSTGIGGPQIAELVFLTALVLRHKYHQIYEDQKKKLWPAGPFTSKPMYVRDMVGQRLGIWGYGNIGRQIARVGKSMGMDVIAHTATPKDTPDKRRDRGYVIPGTGDPEGKLPSEWYSGLDKESLHNFISQDIDFLVLSAPLTQETTHAFSTEEFKILSKRKPLISNISRGGVIDSAALVEAMKAGHLSGAHLDVAEVEPLPPSDPLWSTPNVIITPHVGANSVNYIPRLLEVLYEIISRRERGEPLINKVHRRPKA